MERLFCLLLSCNRVICYLIGENQCRSKQNWKTQYNTHRSSVCGIQPPMSWPKQCRKCFPMPNLASGQRLKTVFIMILICHDRSHLPTFLKSSNAWQKSSVGTIPLCVNIGHVSKHWNTFARKDSPIKLKLSKTCQIRSKSVFTSSSTTFLNSVK